MLGGADHCSGVWIQTENEVPFPKDQKQRMEDPPKVERKLRAARSCTVRGYAGRFLNAIVEPDPPRRPAGPAIKEEPKYKIITPLVRPAPPSQQERWSLRSMWELASIFNFLNTFRHLLNINVEFSAEELETALITPNGTLDDVHMPLLKAIPPVTRMALGRATWVTVLCRKLRDWWHWVAEGEIPIVASHGTEIELYKMLEPSTRVVILKALCDIRVEQEDIRSYMEKSIKHGAQLSMFRHERIGGDSYGTNYWYEDDPIIGHRLYREIRKVETKRFKKGVPTEPIISCQWETIAANLDEFQEVSEKLLSSKNRTEASLAKRLKIDVLPEIEKIQKRKERTLKKQHRQALLLDTFITADRLAAGRSLRDRKPVTYTFDAFDRSINEAIKITKKRQHYLDPAARSEFISKPDGTTNGRVNGPTRVSNKVSVDTSSPKSTDNEETDGEHISGSLDRRNRRRQRPQWYSEFVEGVSDNDTEFDSDDDIIGEAVYDEEYLRYRKQRKALNSSAGDEYRNGKMGEDDDEEEYEEEEEEDSPGVTMEGRGSGVPTKPPRSRRETKLRSMDEIESGLRRSKRPVKNRIDYSHYEFSDVEAHSSKADKPDSTVRRSIASDSVDYSMESDDSQQDEEVLEKNNNGSSQYLESTIRDSSETLAKLNSPGQDIDGQGERKFLDLNLLAPGIGFDDRTGGGMVGDGKNS